MQLRTHKGVRINRDRTGDAANLHDPTATADGLHGIHRQVRRSLGPEGIEHHINAARYLRQHLLMDRAAPYQHRYDTPWIKGLEPFQGVGIAGDDHDLRSTECQGKKGRTDAEGSTCPKNENALRRAQGRLANGRIRSPQIAKAGSVGKAQTLGQTHQVVPMGRHVLAITAVGITLEDLLRARPESEVTHEGIGLATRRIPFTTPATLATADARIDVDPIPGLEHRDCRTDRRHRSGRVQAKNGGQFGHW